MTGIGGRPRPGPASKNASTAREPGILNASQGRALAITLRLVEERLAEIETILERDASGRLYRRLRPDLSPEARDRVVGLLTALRSGITDLADEYRLEAESRDGARAIAALLAMSWENLGEVVTGHLRAYGEVDPQLTTTLDPAVERLMRLVLELQQTVTAAPDGNQHRSHRARR